MAAAGHKKPEKARPRARCARREYILVSFNLIKQTGRRIWRDCLILSPLPFLFLFFPFSSISPTVFFCSFVPKGRVKLFNAFASFWVSHAPRYKGRLVARRARNTKRRKDFEKLRPPSGNEEKTVGETDKNRSKSRCRSSSEICFALACQLPAGFAQVLLHGSSRLLESHCLGLLEKCQLALGCLRRLGLKCLRLEI